MEAIKKRFRSLNSDNENGYAVAVLIALIVVSGVIAGYYLLMKPQFKGFSTIYLLDSEGTAVNYPELVVINQNKTFDVQVAVENHMGKRQHSEIIVKITDETIALFPVSGSVLGKYEKTLNNEEKWETSAAITLTEPGKYSVVFELWIYNEETEQLEFSENACVLNVEVVNAT